MKKKVYIVPVLMSALLFASCERRPLVSTDKLTNIRVQINTEAIANVSADIYNDKISLSKIDPEMMHVVFFEADGDRIVSESYISRKYRDSDGNTTFYGETHIGPGCYKVMIYNFGTESTIVRDYDSWSGAQAYTERVPENIMRSYRSKASDNENISYEPDHLLIGVEPCIVIPRNGGIYTLEMSAHTIIDTYYLQIKVEGLEYVSSASAFLSGMSSGNHLAENLRVSDPQSTVYFTLEKSDDKGVPVICSNFNTFGHIDGNTNTLEVTFELKTTDGRIVQESFDISGLFETPEAKVHRWLLLEETITVDPPENPDPKMGGGLAPSVGDWESEDHDITL